MPHSPSVAFPTAKAWSAFSRQILRASRRSRSRRQGKHAARNSIISANAKARKRPQFANKLAEAHFGVSVFQIFGIFAPMAYRRCGFRYERKLRATGVVRIAGVDEAGRGALAGPVVAAAVVLPEKFKHRKLNDSKQLSPERRDEIY